MEAARSSKAQPAEGTMLKIASMTAGAALIAGLLVAFPGMSRHVEASTPLPAAKTDRLDLRTTGPACSQRGWPYFETSCLRNPAAPDREAKAARIVSIDRLR